MHFYDLKRDFEWLQEHWKYHNLKYFTYSILLHIILLI